MPDEANITKEIVVNEPEPSLNDTVERFGGILRSRRWWILGPLWSVSVAVAAFAMHLPSRYLSQATLLVVQQQVSQKYVQPDSTTSIPAAVQAMKLEVLSRSRLLQIINDLGLYDSGTERSAPELLVERMRKDIDIQPLESSPGRNDFDAFTISFTAETPHLAQEVTSRLTSLFIEQNLKNRGEQAADTTKFLAEQLDAAKQRLAQQEQRLQAFKTENLGELPEQQQTNLAALTDTRYRLETIAATLLQTQQQQISIEASLNDRLARLESEKTALLAQYTPRYPGVVQKDREIAKVQSVLDRLHAERAAPIQVQDAPQDYSSVDDPVLAGIIRQAEANAAQRESLLKQQQRLRGESNEYQNRLSLTPVREQQLSGILRDYDLFRQDYTDLLNKKLQSDLTTSLEEDQKGQHFRLVDAPSLPLKPFGSKRLKICLSGMAGGIFLGVALGFLMDMRDSSFHNEKALAQTFVLPVVLGVPMVRTRAEQRLRSWRTRFEWFAASVMTLAMFAAEFYVFRKG
jgi:protein tyrosine kinase modulator